MNIKNAIPAVVSAVALGCTPTETISNLIADKDTSAVVIGMENSRFAGNCPGAKVDASRMAKLLAPYAGDIIHLTDGSATYSAVYSAIAKAVKSDLAIIYYSGHGGASRHSADASETDGQDEYLCLYDREMLDDDVWSLISRSKGRVFLVFDCCHSGTMYRVPQFTMKLAQKREAAARASLGFSMLCWSGCPDDTYSYGDANGGKFTNTFLKHFKAGMSYTSLWKKICTDSGLASYESVQQTKTGTDFSAKEVFK